MAARRGRKGGLGGGGRGIMTIIMALFGIAIIIAGLRAFGIYDIKTFLSVTRGGSSSIQSATTQKSQSVIDKLLSCNILKKDSCGTESGASSNGSASNGTSESTSGDSSNGASQSQSGDTPNGGKSPNGTTIADDLRTADADGSSYASSDYPRWTMVNGSCDTRGYLMTSLGFAAITGTCTPTEKDGFSYTVPYTGKKESDPDKLILDHVISLKYANQHGAKSWSTARKTAFANDTTTLIPTDKATEALKGGNGPGTWMPTKDYQCQYATSWATIARKYGLSVTTKDKTALQKTLRTCSQ